MPGTPCSSIIRPTSILRSMAAISAPARTVSGADDVVVDATIAQNERTSGMRSKAIPTREGFRYRLSYARWGAAVAVEVLPRSTRAAGIDEKPSGLSKQHEFPDDDPRAQA